MAGIRFDLSSPDAIERLRDLAEAMLELTGDLTPELSRKLEEKAKAFGVHRVDFEKIVEEAAGKSVGLRPPWADAAGRDSFGRWACLAVGKTTRKMRWIPAGEFVMGSPESEEGRFDREIQHSVVLTRGYWLLETPVTQQLWKEVMVENPSYFKSDNRPVEKVSWDDCKNFLEKINKQRPGLDARLPTEAEWEYACRAGTETATYAGDLEIKGEHNAPALDAIAWYAGNCGVDFELKNGADFSGVAEKQYGFTLGGSHPVSQKNPNPWGLYDMLGNVLEWCEDWYKNYDAKDRCIDPGGPATGSSRVVRGGGWNSRARSARSAFRTAAGRTIVAATWVFALPEVRSERGRRGGRDIPDKGAGRVLVRDG